MKHRQATRRITISMSSGEFAWIERWAKLVHHGNVSAAFLDGVRALRRREALRDFLRLSKAPKLSAEEVAAILAEVRGPKPRRQRAA